MFDVGFWEICLIGVIALIVIGPERLPRVARVTGLWIGKVRGLIRTVKHDIDEQLRLEELRQTMEKQDTELHRGVNELNETVDSLKEIGNKEIKPSDSSNKPPN